MLGGGGVGAPAAASAFFQFFFNTRGTMLRCFELCGITSNARLNVRHGIGQLLLQMAMAGYFFGALAGLQLDLPRADAGEGH